MGILSNDSILGRFFGKIGDIILLNVLFVICSIPIFTIGISYTSMEYAFLKKERQSDASIIKSFFHSFRENFKQSTISWLLVLLLIFVLTVDFRMFGPSGVMPVRILYYLFLLISFVVLFTTLYLFPVISAFRNTTGKLIAQAFFLAVKNIPYTLCMCFLLAIPVYLTLTYSDYFLLSLTLWLFFIFGFIGYIYALAFIHIFTPYLGDAE